MCKAKTLCGPVAIAALTSVSTDKVVDIVADYRRAVSFDRLKDDGMNAAELMHTLTSLGFSVYHEKWRQFTGVYYGCPPTFWRYIRDHLIPGVREIIGTTEHWIARWDDSFRDNGVKESRPLGEYPNKRQRVDQRIIVWNPTTERNLWG